MSDKLDNLSSSETLNPLKNNEKCILKNSKKTRLLYTYL